jgi:hexosaminidase
MRNTITILLVSVAIALGSAPGAAASLPVVPLPRQVQVSAGAYRLVSNVVGVDASGESSPDADELHVVQILTDYLGSTLHMPAPQGHGPVAPDIRISDRANDSQLGDEGYRLTVDDSGIAIEANTGAGLFYGAQTLEQLLPDQPDADIEVRHVQIVDWPEYRWRGIHLDVSRHFFPVSVVEQYIDLAARYKLNMFHWHLTDDQGWRIEIKKYPRLTQIGGCRDGTQVGGEGKTETDGKRYCGFYTQDQIREVVAYAKERYVTIVPEIDMPGHSVAAIASYPWLGCDGKQYAVRELWGVSTQIMCPTEKTFAFIDDEIGELASLFPGPYVHIGGDEVPTDAWQASPFVTSLMAREHLRSYAAVQGYFTRRVEAIVAKHGKRVVGWDDILAGGVAPGTTVMAWDDVKSAVAAAKTGTDVVINPDGPLYFDAAQGNETYEPLSIGGLTTLQMVYDFDPMPVGLDPVTASHIIGAQGDVWAEYIPTADHLFYMLLPRELALSELCWTPRSEMEYDDFTTRMEPQLARLEAEGYHYRIPDVTFTVESGALRFPEQQSVANELDVTIGTTTTSVDMHDAVDAASIHYSIDGSIPTAASPAFGASPGTPGVVGLPLQLSLGKTLVLCAVAVLPDGRTSAPSFLRLTASLRVLTPVYSPGRRR